MPDVTISTPFEQATVTDAGVQQALKNHIQTILGRTVLGRVEVIEDTDRPRGLTDEPGTVYYTAIAKIEPESKA